MPDNARRATTVGVSHCRRERQLRITQLARRESEYYEFLIQSIDADSTVKVAIVQGEMLKDGLSGKSADI